MGAPKKKLQDLYAEDKDLSPAEQKRMIQVYLDKIAKLLEDPKKQKQAAEIISQLINNQKK